MKKPKKFNFLMIGTAQTIPTGMYILAKNVLEIDENRKYV